MSYTGSRHDKEKAALEKRLLRRQLSLQGLLLPWIQAATVPVALLGATFAFFVGLGQLRQSADNQAAEHFDKALTRLLVAAQAVERMTGVSGLEFFISDGSPPLQKQALQVLLDRLSTETDEVVSGAILDLFTDLKPGQTSQTALDSALKTAIRQNRKLARLILVSEGQRLAQKRKEILAKFQFSNVDLNTEDDIPIGALDALTTEQYFALLDAERQLRQTINSSQRVPLKALGNAIQILVNRGATSDDFRAIFCEQCDFRKAKSLDGVNFNYAYLANANFEHVSLQGAHFQDAYIGGTNFFDANLAKADLSANFLEQRFASNGYNEILPVLECADLRGADLSGRPMILFDKGIDADFNGETHHSWGVTVLQMISAQLDEWTKLDKFTIVINIRVRDSYLKMHPDAPEALEVRHKYWNNPLAGGPNWNVFSSSTSQQRVVRFSGDTTGVIEWSLGSDELQYLGDDAFRLRGFIEQPALKVLPFYSRFVDTVRALNVPANDTAKNAKAWSDKAAEALATMKRPSCHERREHTLLFSSGFNSSTVAPYDGAFSPHPYSYGDSP